MKRPRACKQPVNLRPIFDNFHNTLRHKVARGIPLNHSQHFQPRLMYGLIYDCLLEKEADKVVRNKGGVDNNLGVIKFSKDYDGRLPKAVKEGFDELIQKDRKALYQVIYPKATRFACARTVGRGSGGKNRIGVACVYDQKAVLTAFDGKGPCKTDNDCTYHGGRCQWNLCYAPVESA
ncbi:hypothetical protein ANCCAN_08843 [Ancylostoma caninum]|uniref:SCP domain-containing protein n=1 Tax=Ancylostoma caninum TaxID=29170 RepID=A0A368GLA9_ANCCA|nr:hypothetical protein ANCCAN_08843 [Ancylostoma caninum]